MGRRVPVLSSWDDPYVREGAEHDIRVLEELKKPKREAATERAKALVAANWHRVEDRVRGRGEVRVTESAIKTDDRAAGSIRPGHMRQIR